MSYFRFRESVQRLAAQPEDQERFLRELGTLPLADELALEFDADFHAERNGLSDGGRNAADLLHQHLRSISGETNAGLWDVSALYNSPEWAHIRDLAAELLKRMDERQ